MGKLILVSETPKHMHRFNCVTLNFTLKHKGQMLLYSILKPEPRPLLPALSGCVKLPRWSVGSNLIHCWCTSVSKGCSHRTELVKCRCQIGVLMHEAVTAVLEPLWWFWGTSYTFLSTHSHNTLFSLIVFMYEQASCLMWGLITHLYCGTVRNAFVYVLQMHFEL